MNTVHLEFSFQTCINVLLPCLPFFLWPILPHGSLSKCGIKENTQNEAFCNEVFSVGERIFIGKYLKYLGTL